MIGLLSVIGPVFALIVMGRLAVHFRAVDLGGLRGLNDFAFYAALPALLFGSVAEAPSLDVLELGSVYFAGCLIVYALAMALARVLLGADLAKSAMIGLNASYGNTVMMGIPIIAASFGQAALSSLLGIIALHSVLLLPLATVLIEAGSAGRSGFRYTVRATTRGLVRNPIIIAIVAALLWRGAGIPVPKMLHGLLSMLGPAGPPIALFCLGAALPGFAGGRVLKEALLASVLKLAVLPALIWALAAWVGLSGQPVAVAVVAAGMPTGANAFSARAPRGQADRGLRRHRRGGDGNLRPHVVRPAGLDPLRARLYAGGATTDRSAAGTPDSQEDLAQERREARDEGDHRQYEQKRDQPGQVHVDQGVDEGGDDRQPDQQRADHVQHDRQIDQLHPVPYHLQLAQVRRGAGIARDSGVALLEHAATVHRTTQARGMDADKPGDRGQQEHRRDRELDRRPDIVDVGVQRPGPPLPAAPATAPMRVSASSRPRAAKVASMPGLTVLPVSAARSGWATWPSLRPAASA
jgi:malonate transporter and related proteins